MKRLFIFTVFAFLCFTFIKAQTFVSTTPENKNIILEEFTGITCVWCPAGHLIGQTLHDNNPNDVFLINIHTGGYATPQGAGTDFNTSFGDAIAAQSNLAGYPAGTVNRHQFTMTQGGGTAMSRSDWGPASTQLLSQPSPVNVGLQASIDMATSTLTVDVEVYYTGNQTITSNMLSIAVVQNNIEGPQTGGQSNNPGSMLANGNYNHNHMLRHMLTGQWGEQISTITPQTLYSNTYTWTIPSQISGYPLSPILDPTNFAVVAFVSEGQQEILSGTEVYPNLIFVNAYDVNLTGSSATDIMCTPTTDLTVNFKNYGNTILSTLDIEYSVNGGSVITYPWTGNLSSGASETVVIQSISVTPLISNSIDVTLVSPNGNTDQNTANNNLTCSFDGMYDAPSGQVTIDVTTDTYGSEITWQLKENGTVIASGGPWSDGSSIVVPTASATISSGNCYLFTIYDSYGDGILTPGSYKVKDVNGNVIVWGGTNSPNGNFTSEESTYFESVVTPSWDCDLTQGCYDPGTGNGQYTSLSNCQAACISTSTDEIESKNISISPNPVKNTLYIQGEMESAEIFDVFGKLVETSTNNTINTSDLADGIYFVRLITNNKIITKKITIVR